MPNWSRIKNELHESAVTSANGSPQKYQEIYQRLLHKKRIEYLGKLALKTGRNVIAYYSGFLITDHQHCAIRDDDKNSFMMAVHELDRKKGLDLIIHSPGGDVAATESIIDYLYKMFGSNIRAIVPQIAMSGGTMIACSCKSILMGKQSNIGPIDPQLNGLPAHGVLKEFDRAIEEIEVNEKAHYRWAPILSQYYPTFLSQCQNAINWSEELLSKNLTAVMFENDKNSTSIVQKIVNKLSHYEGNKNHSRHIHMQDCIDMGLKIEKLEDDQELQDIVLTIHHCFIETIATFRVIKIIENHLGQQRIQAETLQ